MLAMQVLRLKTILVLSACLSAGCDGDPVSSCVPGATASCACTDGSSGAQECRADGTYATCVCEGSAVDTGSDVPDLAVDHSADQPEAADQREPDTRLCGTVVPTPTFIDSGATDVGSTRRVDVTIRSNACVPIEVSRISLDRSTDDSFALEDVPSELGVSEGSLTLPPGGSLTFVVAYSPQDTQTHSGRVIIEHSGGVLPIVLSGSGRELDLRAEDSEGIWIEMWWDSAADVDLHFLHPNGTWDVAPWDCTWKNRNPDWGDIGSDDDDPVLMNHGSRGWGPEIIHLSAPEGNEDVPFTYAVGAFLFSDRGCERTDVTVRILVDGVEGFSSTYEGLEAWQFWDVARVTWPGGEVELVNELCASGFP